MKNLSFIIYFADDINLLYASKNLKNIESVKNSEFKRLVNWPRVSKH